ncbi:alpha/beta fold hydrolase [Pseudanabaena cinerea]|nr:alpha/beta hydrolase [Pseudanabaena cinerea]
MYAQITHIKPLMKNQNLRVLCLHGHPGNSDAMQIFVQHFQSQGIQALAPSLRGYGDCKANLPFTMLDHIQDLENILNISCTSNHSDENSYLLLGWSLGGILAMELALRYEALKDTVAAPPSIRPKIVGLILIATAAKPRSNLPKIHWWEYTNLAIAIFLHWLLSKTFSHPPTWHIQWFGKHSLIKYLIQQHTLFAYDCITNIGSKAFFQTSHYAHNALSKALKQGYDRTGDLSKITMPCLAIAADRDLHITPHSTIETAHLLPNCQLICYPNTAHLLPWEIREQLLADIDQWCAQNI